MLRRIVVAGVVLFVVGVGGCSSDDASESNDGDGGPSSGDDGGTPDGGVDAGPGGDAASDASTDAAVGACSDGSPLVARFDTCNASPPAAPSTVTSALATATRGGVISLGSAASAPATD